MNITKVYSNVIKKESIIEQIAKEFSIKPSEIAYIGDDVNDVEIAKKVGLSATPKDGIITMKKNTHYTCTLGGGQGAFRELSDLILTQKFKNNVIWYWNRFNYNYFCCLIWYSLLLKLELIITEI